ncbi:MAG TPA: hypothetical protein VFO16_05845 [Pseudonocardiaceae bacterium]|nr:hypothetical protein [Pseudonocardiaceae bacterium]
MNIAGLPYWEITFDAQGALVNDGQLPAELPGQNLTDLFLLCHGWNATTASARELYQAMFTLLADQVREHAPGRVVGAAGVFWPAAVFPEDDPASAVTASTGQQLAAAMAPVFAPPQREALTRIGELLDTAPADSGRLREAHGLIRGLVTSPSLDAAEDSGEAAMLTQPTAAVFGHFAGMSRDRDDAQSLGDVFHPLWGGARTVFRLTSYYEMKNRAGVVGRSGLGPLLARLISAGGGPRVHLLGHSFGARLVAFALSGLPGDRRGTASPVKSLTLIQGAFSHFSFAQPMPIDAARSGALAGARSGVDGPLLATFSAADRAVGWWYPTASLLSHSDSEGASDLTYRWGAMGHDGYQQQDATEMILKSPGKPYTFGKGLFHRLNSNAVIADAHQSSFGGAHSDIRHPEVLWAALAAALA